MTFVRRLTGSSSFIVQYGLFFISLKPKTETEERGHTGPLDSPNPNAEIWSDSSADELQNSAESRTKFKQRNPSVGRQKRYVSELRSLSSLCLGKTCLDFARSTLSSCSKLTTAFTQLFAALVKFLNRVFWGYRGQPFDACPRLSRSNGLASHVNESWARANFEHHVCVTGVHHTVHCLLKSHRLQYVFSPVAYLCGCCVVGRSSPPLATGRQQVTTNTRKIKRTRHANQINDTCENKTSDPAVCRFRLLFVRVPLFTKPAAGCAGTVAVAQK
eukprot:Selendium_serpulae@DN6491_c2_g5_i4.p1